MCEVNTCTSYSGLALSCACDHNLCGPTSSRSFDLPSADICADWSSPAALLMVLLCRRGAWWPTTRLGPSSKHGQEATLASCSPKAHDIPQDPYYFSEMVTTWGYADKQLPCRRGHQILTLTSISFQLPVSHAAPLLSRYSDNLVLRHGSLAQQCLVPRALSDGPAHPHRFIPGTGVPFSSSAPASHTPVAHASQARSWASSFVRPVALLS